MPFEAEDVYAGMIAYFTVNKLRRDARIRSTAKTRDTKPRPFVCYAEVDGESYWTPLTGTFKKCRDTIDRKWLRLASGTFVGRDTIILADCRNGFAGPNEVFAEQSLRYDGWKGIWRPSLMREGVDEVLRHVRRQGGLMPQALRCAAPQPLRRAA